jgi:hypothetical protein
MNIARRMMPGAISPLATARLGPTRYAVSAPFTKS